MVIYSFNSIGTYLLAEDFGFTFGITQHIVEEGTKIQHHTKAAALHLQYTNSMVNLQWIVLENGNLYFPIQWYFN